MPCTHRIEIAWRGEEREGDGGGLIPFAWMFLSEEKGFEGIWRGKTPHQTPHFQILQFGGISKGRGSTYIYIK